MCSIMGENHLVLQHRTHKYCNDELLMVGKFCRFYKISRHRVISLFKFRSFDLIFLMNSWIFQAIFELEKLTFFNCVWLDEARIHKIQAHKKTKRNQKSQNTHQWKYRIKRAKEMSLSKEQSWRCHDYYIRDDQLVLTLSHNKMILY